MDIEEVEKTPELILSEPFDPDRGLGAYQARLMASKLGYQQRVGDMQCNFFSLV